MRINACPIVNGPVPVLLSVADAFTLKLPAAVGVPEMVRMLAVVLVTNKPAGKLVAAYPLHGGAPPFQVKAQLNGVPTAALNDAQGVMEVTGMLTVMLTVAGAEVPPELVAV